MLPKYILGELSSTEMHEVAATCRSTSVHAFVI